MTSKRQKTGVVLFAHGSSVEEANRRVHDLARQVEEMSPHGYVRAAFLERAQPDLDMAIAQAAEAELTRVIIIPYFLSVGVHLRRDLPSLVAAARKRHPGLEIEIGEGIEGHPLIVSIILERIQELDRETKGSGRTP